MAKADKVDIKRVWELFERDAFPVNAPDHVREAIRAAYVAGASAILVALIQIRELPEEDGTAALEQLFADVSHMVYEQGIGND